MNELNNIEENSTFLASLPQNPRNAAENVLDKLLKDIHPLIIKIRDNIQLCSEDEEISKIRDVFKLCLSQVTKCVLNLFEIFRLEYSRLTTLYESRQCYSESLSWCYKRLQVINKYLNKKCLNNSESNESNNETLNLSTMYFVNWIDHTFEVLNKLSSIVYKTDYKDSEESYDGWINDVVECVSSLHISVDELLLCAMTLCKYCLPSDQNIVKARCQVVLRETKSLLSELITGDVSSTIQVTADSIKLPLMPSTINVMIDVLKDVLYVLETNTNTALLALLIHCFSNNTSPIDALKQHFVNNSQCHCIAQTSEDTPEDCPFIKDFDLYNERLLQIGSFAVSCSSDENRMLSLRSALASLEALDPHLLPALLAAPRAGRARLLADNWKREVHDIKNNVFLIVDPVAFADKSKQMMHQYLLEVLKSSACDSRVCAVVAVGGVFVDFFDVYCNHEPEALTEREKLLPLLSNLKKVQTECKIVCNLLSEGEDYKYDVKMPKTTDVSLEQLFKRLKLFYTLVTRVNSLLRPQEIDQTFDDGCEVAAGNVTHTIVKNNNTYVNSPIKNNVTRSIFARTNVRSSTRNNPLSKLTKHLRLKNNSELSFSVQLDRLFNGTNEDKTGEPVEKRLRGVREQSILYNLSPIRRASLRKVVLNRHLKSTPQPPRAAERAAQLLGDDESLQLTQVLNELTDMTTALITTKSRFAAVRDNILQEKNVVTININNQTPRISKHIWNIPVSAPAAGAGDARAADTSASHTSNVNTLERLSDLRYVETKLNSLKLQMETTL